MVARALAGLEGAIEAAGGALWGTLLSARILAVWITVLLVTALLMGLLPRQAGQPHADGSALLWQATGASPDAPGAAGTVGAWAVRLLLAGAAVLAATRLLHHLVSGWVAPAPRSLRAHYHDLPGDRAAVQRIVEGALAAAGLCVARVAERDGVRYLAARPRLARRLPAVAFWLGVLLIMAGAAVQARLGWRGPAVELALGDRRPLDQEQQWQVRLEELQLTPRPDGSLRRIVAAAQVSMPDGSVQRVTLTPGHPGHVDGLRLYYLGQGPALRLAARAGDEETIVLRPLTFVGDPAPQVRVRLSDRQQEHALALPGRDLLLRVTYYPPSEVDTAAVDLRAERGSDGSLLAETLLDGDGVLDVGDVRFEVRHERYVRLMAAREPGLWPAGVGGVLALLGAAGMVAAQSRRAWVALAAAADGARCCVYLSPEADGSRWSERLLIILQGEQAR